MNEFFSSLLTTLGSIKSETISLLVGFIVAWLLFEVTERRRMQLGQRELRRALVAELENAKVLVSIFVGKYARLCKSDEDIAFVADAIRWYKGVGRQQLERLGVLSDLPPVSPEFEKLSDNEIIVHFSTIKQTVGNKLILPVVERSLAGQTFGFSADQIQALSMVRWQTYLLEQEAELMQEMFRLTFTVTDEGNLKTVIENHERLTEGYALRTRTLLRAIRAALELMREHA